MDIVLISCRMLFAFVLILIFFQFSGSKRQFSQMTSFDLISNFVLSSILGGFLFNPDLSWQGFVYVLTLYFAISFLINYLAKNTSWGRGMIIGTPTVIIHNGELLQDNLRKMNMNMTDFMSLLRTKEVHALSDVRLAQIEVGGELTIVLKGEEDFSRIIIENGHINEENLKKIKKSKTWLRQKLKKQKIKEEEVFFAEWSDDDLYIIKFK